MFKVFQVFSRFLKALICEGEGKGNTNNTANNKRQGIFMFEMFLNVVRFGKCILNVSLVLNVFFYAFVVQVIV